MPSNFTISRPNLVYARSALYRAPAPVAANAVGAWFFNKAPGETDEEAGQRCSRNRVPGANTDLSARRWIGGVPTFFSGYARFREDQPLVTDVADPGAALTMFVLARTLDANTGSSSLHRGFVAGTYGGNNAHGFDFEFASYASATARGVDFEDDGTIRTSQIDMGDSGALDDWRIYQIESGVDGLQARNLNPGDGPIPEPAPTPLIGGRKTGSQTVTIGGRIEDTATVYDPALEKDVGAVLLFNSVLGTTDRAAVAAQLALYAAAVGLTIGAA